MLLFQLFSCKAFVPKFTWGAWNIMRTMPTEAEIKELNKFKFLIPVEQMASQFGKHSKNEVMNEVSMLDFEER